VKTIRVTYRKDGATAVCTARYRNDDFPHEEDWSGDRGAFVMPSGRLIPGPDALAKAQTVAQHYASLCGATAEVEDLGGEARAAIM
jgi:hypothetical protein